MLRRREATKRPRRRQERAGADHGRPARRARPGRLPRARADRALPAPRVAAVIRGVLLDALGTLVRLEPPGPRLQASLRARLGLDVPLDRCAAAMQAEMSLLRRALRARTRRRRAGGAATRVRGRARGRPRRRPDRRRAASVPDRRRWSFTRVPRRRACARRRCASQGRRLAVVSNWDVSLPPVLRAARTRARPSRSSCTRPGVGAAKPDPRPFRVALERLALAAGECVHVGDDPVNDGEGAAAAGLRAILVDRDGRAAGEPARPLALGGARRCSTCWKRPELAPRLPGRPRAARARGVRRVRRARC